MDTHPPAEGRSRARTSTTDLAVAALGLLGHLDPGVLLALTPVPGGEVDVSVRAVAADHRCGGAGLFGITAPHGAAVAGCSFHARTDDDVDDHPHDDRDDEGHGPDRRLDVLVAHDGRVLSQVHDPDGTVTALAGPAAGVVVDALHRVLGLPSPGAPPPLETLVGALWIGDLLARVGPDPGDGPTWADAVRLHPCSVGPSVVLPSPEALAASTRTLVAEVSWERLRRAAASGRGAVPDLSPDEADWMDDTFFARWVLESFPPPGVSVALLEAVGAAGAAAGVRSVLERLGVDVGGM
jgi:hypothetical protein